MLNPDLDSSWCGRLGEQADKPAPAPIQERCNFAYPGTYGHECGKPATLVAIRRTTLTYDGLFYARRCPECARIKGFENQGILRIEPLDTNKHRNQWIPGKYTED